MPENDAMTFVTFRLRAAGLALLCALTGTRVFAQAAPAAADTPGAAAAPASDWRFNGFGTLAAVDAFPRDGWGFRRELTQPEHHDTANTFATDSRLGFQADWRPDAQWELVGQLVFKPRAHDASLEETVAWAFAAWRPSPDWTIRAGRTSPDLFLLADARNVGFAYPWMRPSVEFYGWMPLSTVDGLDATREWHLGDAHVAAKLFAGRSHFTLASAHDNGDENGTTDPLMGGTLTADANGLTFKATFAEARTRPANAKHIDELHAGLDGLAALPIPVIAAQAAALRDTFPVGTLFTRYSAVAVAWSVDPWQVQAELSRITGNFIASQDWYGYASVAYRVGNVTPFAMFGRARSSRAPLASPNWTQALTPILGPQNAALAQYAGADIADTYNIGREDQRSVSLGARWDVAAQVALKLQVDAIHSAPYGGGMWAFDTLSAHHAVVVSAGMDFVF